MNLIISIFPYVMFTFIPIFVVALGGLFSEKSGVVNIGLEGLMVMGAFGASMTIWIFVQLGIRASWVVWLALIIGVLVGILTSLLHAFASVSLNANQVISGTAINMLSTPLTIYLVSLVLNGEELYSLENYFFYRDIPLLKDIPIIGEMLFTRTYPTTWLAIIILIVAFYVLYKTPYGLRLRSVGEHPQASASVGISVHQMRYQAVMISGALAGLGGAIIMVTSRPEFNGMMNGIGFLALASLIFGQWHPVKVFFATLFFGFALTLSSASLTNPELRLIPRVFIDVLPYVFTLVALALSSKNSRAPKALGEVYNEGQR